MRRPGGRAGAPLRRTTNLSDVSPNRLVVGHSAVAQNLGVESAELDATVLGNDGFVLVRTGNGEHIWMDVADGALIRA